MCGSKENLEAHHLESKHYSPSLMLSLGNGIILCDRCHDEFHSFCGGKKASRHDFYKWLQARKNGKTTAVATKKIGIRPTTAEEIERVKEIARRLLQENPRAGRYTLVEKAGCSHHVAQMVLEELKQSS